MLLKSILSKEIYLWQWWRYLHWPIKGLR